MKGFSEVNFARLRNLTVSLDTASPKVIWINPFSKVMPSLT